MKMLGMGLPKDIGEGSRSSKISRKRSHKDEGRSGKGEHEDHNSGAWGGRGDVTDKAFKGLLKQLYTTLFLLIPHILKDQQRIYIYTQTK